MKGSPPMECSRTACESSNNDKKTSFTPKCLTPSCYIVGMEKERKRERERERERDKHRRTFCTTVSPPQTNPKSNIKLNSMKHHTINHRCPLETATHSATSVTVGGARLTPEYQARGGFTHVCRLNLLLPLL